MEYLSHWINRYDRVKLAYHLCTWLALTVLSSLIPQGIQLVVSTMMGGYPDDTTTLLEILIVAIVISANSLKELFESNLYQKKRLFSFGMLVLGMCTVAVPSIMYGLVISGKSYSYSSAYQLALLSAIVSFFSGLIIRIYTAEERDEDVDVLTTPPPSLGSRPGRSTVAFLRILPVLATSVFLSFLCENEFLLSCFLLLSTFLSAALLLTLFAALVRRIATPRPKKDA